MGKTHGFVYGLLVGIITVLGVLLVTRAPEKAYAQAADSNGNMVATTGFGSSGQSSPSYLWIVDTNTKRVAVYDCNQGKSIKCLGVRNFTWDMIVPLEAQANLLEDLGKLKEEAIKWQKKQEEEDKKKGGK